MRLLAIAWGLVIASSVRAEGTRPGEVFRLTSPTERGKTFYYTNNGFSKDGRLFAYFCDRRVGERVGFRSTAISHAFPKISIQFADYPWHGSGHEEGVWTPDSKRYYLNYGSYFIDMGARRLDRLARVDEFYWPSLSPDGTQLCGINKRHDRDKKIPQVTCLRHSDGTLRSFRPPYLSEELDVTYGWVGNRHLWFRTGEKRTLIPVVSVEDGRTDGYLNVFREQDRKPMKFYHMNVSPAASALGSEGKGFIVGHTPGLYVANANFNTRGTAKERALRFVGEQPGSGARFVPVGTHTAISPDEKTVVVENVMGNMGVLAAYSLEERRSEPTWLVRYRPAESYNEADEKTWRPYPMPQWSPDGTKIAFTGAAIEGDGLPYVYFYVFKLPEAPHLKDIAFSNGRVATRFSAHDFSYEISHWELLYAESNSGHFVPVARIPKPDWHVSDVRDPGSIVLTSHSRDGTQFAATDWILEGAAPSLPKERMTCRSIKVDSMLCVGVTAADDGREAAKGSQFRVAWPNYSESPALIDGIALKKGWYAIRAVEHSGLASDPSNTLFIDRVNH